MEALLKSNRLLASTAVAALLAGATALTPGALASGQAHTCANKVVVIEIPATPGSTTGPTKFKVTIKAISTQGVSCAAAYKFLTLVYENTTSATPEHYKCKTGHFKVPIGEVPEVCTKPGAKIQYGAQGG